MNPTGLGARAARASWWGAVEIAARHLVQLTVMLVLARLLAPSDFGLVAMLLVFTSIGTLLADSGLGWALIQRGASDDDEETSAFVFSLALAMLAAAAVWVGTPWIARFYRHPDLMDLVQVMVWVIPLTALAVVPDALLARSLEFRIRAKAEVVSSTTAGAGAILLAWGGYGVWSLVWMPVLLAMVRAPVLWAWAGWRPRGRFRWPALRRLLGFGSYVLAANLLEAVSIRLQSLLIGRMFDSRVLGFYTLAQHTEQAPTTFVTSLLNRIGLPVLSSVANEPAKLQEALRRALRLSMFLFAPVLVGIAVAAQPLVLLLYGQDWEPVAPILAVLALASSLWPMHVLNLAAINAKGRSDLVLRLAVLKKILMISLVVVASQHGPIAIAWAILASSVIAVVANTWFSRSLTGVGLAAQIWDQLPTAAAVAAAALTASLILGRWPNTLLCLVLAASASALVYFVTALALRNRALVELAAMVRAVRLNGGV